MGEMLRYIYAKFNQATTIGSFPVTEGCLFAFMLAHESRTTVAAVCALMTESFKTA
jgi:hypothetical protein